MERIHLYNIPASAYEHPMDRETLETLESFSFLEGAIKSMLDWSRVKAEYVIRRASSYHVTEESCPELNKLVTDAASILSVSDIPRVYLNWSYDINGYTTGYKDTTMMVLNTGVVDLMSDMEQTFVIGHELGHIKSKHVIYHNLALLLSQGVSNIPIIGAVPELFFLALTKWSRMSEYTSDRAGLLACQDVDSALTAIVKMSGVPAKYFDRINIDAFLREARDIESELTWSDKMYQKVINAVYNDHPWTLLRAYELKKWVDSGEYQKILDTYKAKKCPDCGGINAPDATECDLCGYTFEC